jgi:hypothetical protein
MSRVQTSRKRSRQNGVSSPNMDRMLTRRQAPAPLLAILQVPSFLLVNRPPS